MQYAGFMGYFGISLSDAQNKKVIKANKLVDVYNFFVGTFLTCDEQMKYQKYMLSKIDKVLNA